MRDRGTRSGPKRRTTDQAPAPHVLDLIVAMEEPRGALVTRLRDITLALPGVEERSLYDGFCRHWTPAYYLGERQLFHVHNFLAGLRATMFVGANTLEPLILDSDLVSADLRARLANTSGHRCTKQFKVLIDSAEDVYAFLEIVRVKWEDSNVRAN